MSASLNRVFICDFLIIIVDNIPYKISLHIKSTLRFVELAGFSGISQSHIIYACHSTEEVIKCNLMTVNTVAIVYPYVK